MRIANSVWLEVVLTCLIVSAPLQLAAQESVCFGTSEKGRLQDGVKLPSKGTNFVSYGDFSELAERTYVHSIVRKVVSEAYRTLESEQSSKVFKFAESGFKNGGEFKPHKTHQNGSSVDFMVPVLNAQGTSVHLPTSPGNKYGYDIEFDSKGRYQEYEIDWEALAAHIVALDKAATLHKISIRRVIIDPHFVRYLHTTRYGAYIKEKIVIPQKKSWVRHDEHYHVDFSLRCNSL